MQSSRAQRLAAVPWGEIEAKIDEHTAAGVRRGEDLAMSAADVLIAFALVLAALGLFALLGWLQRHAGPRPLAPVELLVALLAGAVAALVFVLK